MASVYVTPAIKEQGAELIRDGTGSSVRSGVEILLKNDLCFGQEEVSPPPDAVDAGPLVQEGLSMLVNYPFDALDISIESQTVDVRKAYKKMALKYHPDKNPRTTPLFLAIQNAHERLTNLVDREEEETKQKAAEAEAAAKAKQSKPPPAARNKSKPAQSTSQPNPNANNSSSGATPSSASESADQQSEMNRRARKKAEQAEQEERQRQEEERAARQKAAKEEAERREAEDRIFPVPSNLQVVCVDDTTVQLQWSPPPACAYTRPPSYLRTELGWRIVADEGSKEQAWNLTPLMRDQTEVVKDGLPAGKHVEFSLSFYIQPSAENQGQMIRGNWCSPVSLTLPQSTTPPPQSDSPSKAKGAGPAATAANSQGASMYHRFLRTVSSLRNDDIGFDVCKVDDDIIPDNWVSDEEDDSDAEDKTDKETPPRPPLKKTNSYRDMDVKWHQLMPPHSHMGSGGRYVHSVYAECNEESAVIGYVTTARKVQAKLRKGDWILVQAHAHSHCLGNTASASFSGFPWGWVKRSQWLESQQQTHIFLRPIPTSLKEVKKYKFLQSVHSMYSLKEEDKSDLNSTQQTETTWSANPPTEEDDEITCASDYYENAEEDVWYEQQDEGSGNVYYYNGTTGESTWEAPQWVVEYDEFSGIRYFVKLDTQSATPLQSKW
eukprot:CAMPEP_0114417826 /NCGR_PEP_ID=MMETSP0103-20121206/3171_1 /TAXON_ID=37642 ORGANISM="Paraphysomonas imperforata, Strain PA2" /NCGR_SAMPLE_ID=MMETSP0103 /ASSEMBLY_ACC=CAM_ASM_000201 /LENGTH=662 /DNA_ID=CAMNT_0001586145 /DNA_START=52 /DNA_END=2037 /DNA_ORIENTATION=+